MGLPGSQPNTPRTGRGSRVVLPDADFSGLGCSPEPWLLSLAHQDLLSGFLHTLPLQSGPLGKNEVTTLGSVGQSWFCPPSASFRGIACSSDQDLGTVATLGHLHPLPLPTVLSPCPRCPVSASQAPLRDQVWGLLCILDHLRYMVTTLSPPLASPGAPSSQCFLLPGPGLFHFLSVDNPICILCVTVGWGERPAFYHAARR